MGQYFEAVILQPKQKGKREEILKGFDPHKYNFGAKLCESADADGKFWQMVESQLYKNPQRLVWAGDYAPIENGYENNLHVESYYRFRTEGKETYDPSIFKQTLFVVNHDVQEYYQRPKNNTLMNPLPILVCEDDGTSKKTLRGTVEYFGLWARNTIELTTDFPYGYTEIKPHFYW